MSDTDPRADSLSSSFHSDMAVLFIFRIDKWVNIEEFSSLLPAYI